MQSFERELDHVKTARQIEKLASSLYKIFNGPLLMVRDNLYNRGERWTFKRDGENADLILLVPAGRFALRRGCEQLTDPLKHNYLETYVLELDEAQRASFVLTTRSGDPTMGDISYSDTSRRIRRENDWGAIRETNALIKMLKRRR